MFSLSLAEVWEFIQKLKEPAKELETKLQKSQDNVKAIQKLVAGWVTHPIFERKDGRKDLLLCLEDYCMERKEKRYKEIKETSGKIKEAIAKNKELIHDEATTPQMWNEYLTYIDKFVVEGLIKTVAVT